MNKMKSLKKRNQRENSQIILAENTSNKCLCSNMSIIH